MPVLQNNNQIDLMQKDQPQQILESTNYSNNNLGFVQNYSGEFVNSMDIDIESFALNQQNQIASTSPSMNSMELGKNNNFSKGRRINFKNIM